jgi:hypothetical protein
MAGIFFVMVYSQGEKQRGMGGAEDVRLKVSDINILDMVTTDCVAAGAKLS